MISLVRNIVFMLGKRGELRNKDILLAPKFSSLIRISEFLSSRVLLLMKLVNYSHILFRVSIDPRVKPEGDRKESVPEGDERGKKLEGNNYYIVMPRFGTNRQGIFELMKNIKLSLRGACLRATWQSQQNANNQPRCSRQSLGLPQHDRTSHASVWNKPSRHLRIMSVACWNFDIIKIA